jgi:excinuclease UvrABC nuclease subunit
MNFRTGQIGGLPAAGGVYAFVDATSTVLYIGESSNFKGRTVQHLFNGSSTVIASRLIDPKEIAYLWFFPVEDSGNRDADKNAREALEAFMINLYVETETLMNVKIPKRPAIDPEVPECRIVTLLPEREIAAMLEPSEMMIRETARMHEIAQQLKYQAVNPLVRDRLGNRMDLAWRRIDQIKRAA